MRSRLNDGASSGERMLIAGRTLSRHASVPRMWHARILMENKTGSLHASESPKPSSTRRPEQRVVGVGEHVEQMRDRGAGIAADVTDTGLQQRLRDGENALAPEDLARPVAELLDVLGERALTHRSGAGRLGGSVATALVGHAFALLVPDRVAARMKEDGEGTTEIELVFRRGTDDLAAARAGLGHAGPRP